MRPIALLRSSLVTLAILAAGVLALVMLVPAAAGYERYVIQTGSMTGTYDAGSIVYAKTVPTSDLRVGDVITYAPPAGEAPTELVTHRIASIRIAEGGKRIFRTKGDANKTVDPWTFELESSRQARAEFGLPQAGNVFLWLSDRETRMLLIGLPALLVALSVLIGMVREARQEARDEAAAGSSAPTAWVQL